MKGRGRNSIAITIRLSTEAIEWLSEGGKEGETVHQRVKKLVMRSYEGRNTLQKEGTVSGGLDTNGGQGVTARQENRSVHQAEHTMNPLSIPGVTRGLKMHEEVDIRGNIVMARGKPRQNMQEAR